MEYKNLLIVRTLRFMPDEIMDNNDLQDPTNIRIIFYEPLTNTFNTHSIQYAFYLNYKTLMRKELISTIPVISDIPFLVTMA